MVVAEGHGIPVSIAIYSATPHEVKLAEPTLKRLDRKFKGCIEHLVADKAYDSLPLRQRLAKQGIELVAPQRSNQLRKVQDGRALRRYRRRWKIERTNAWLQNFRRVTVRWDRKTEIYLAFVRLACILIAIRHL